MRKSVNAFAQWSWYGLKTKGFEGALRGRWEALDSVFTATIWGNLAFSMRFLGAFLTPFTGAIKPYWMRRFMRAIGTSFLALSFG